MLDSGSSEGGNPQLYQALQAQKAAANSSGGSGDATAHGGGGGQLPPGLANLANMGHGGLPGGGAAPHGAPAASAPPPREVSSIPEELVTRPIRDIGQEFTVWFDINKLFGINVEDTPEEKARKQQLHARYQQLTSEEQQLVQKRFQQEQQRKHRMEEEHQMELQKKQAEASNAIAPPSSPQKGAVDPNASKSSAQRMANTVQQNRQSFNKVQSSG
jgi:hypothetical protein